MKKHYYIGIDPGMTGAVAIISNNNDIQVFDCPETIPEMVAIIKPYKGQSKALIEKVNPFYKSSAKSAFTFGGNFSAWQAILASFEIPYEFITPRKWQKIMFDSANKVEDTKKQSFERTIRLYPIIELKTKRGKILDGRCDALLIATLLKQKNKP